jgi:hypothetical protein
MFRAENPTDREGSGFGGLMAKCLLEQADLAGIKKAAGQ